MDQNNILLSIITICKNDLTGIKKTYNSINSQIDVPFHKIEWFIKDGMSEDGTQDYIDKIVNLDSMCINKISDNDLGIYDAMNVGIDNSCGGFIQFLNAGDTYFTQDSLCSVLNEIRLNKDILMIYGGHEDVFENGESIIKPPREIEYLHTSLPCSHQAIFYNRHYIKDIRYDLKYSTSADYQFTAEIYNENKNKEASIIKKPIIKFFAGGNSTIKQQELLYDCFKIRRNVLSKSFINCSIDYVRRWLALKMFHHFNKTYKVFRTIFG